MWLDAKRQKENTTGPDKTRIIISWKTHANEYVTRTPLDRESFLLCVYIFYLFFPLVLVIFVVLFTKSRRQLPKKILGNTEESKRTTNNLLSDMRIEKTKLKYDERRG